MTDTAEFEISVRDDATQADRENAERSVAALVARSVSAVAQERAAEADLAELTDPLRRPFMKLIQEAPPSPETLEKLRTHQLMQAYKMDALEQAPFTGTYDALVPQDVLSNTRSLGFVPPYDFSWAWHDGSGHPPFNQVLDRPSGSVGLDARSGSLPGGASGFINAHVGFGVFLRSDTTGQRFPHAVLNPGRFSFAARAVGVGSNATTEGGFELTVFEDGQFLTGASRRLWRARVSGSVFDPDESTSGSQGPQVMAGPELAFTIKARSWVYIQRGHLGVQ
ncbi:hypothetical protein SAMN05216228_1003328 [Rhizobium tibeticum]|uniref:Uncharacterized protein n=1 Tax=Rhizobium tibeticum TaxID=501024 RepID=A0A1H8FJW8_9HYPH|nr:hypothetical protein [Rhizobium tibeticum]SEH42644.1 hypothetical protein RTCCBAU85039_0321 [Rhizobium tibeticum]SEN31804.1 hypothetical protein SAMN05216228_1003328 [Rhizobium tibeticum]